MFDNQTMDLAYEVALDRLDDFGVGRTFVANELHHVIEALSLAGLLRRQRCGRCGVEREHFSAAIGDEWYCHGDGEPGRSCYEQAQADITWAHFQDPAIRRALLDRMTDDEVATALNVAGLQRDFDNRGEQR